MMPNDIDWSIFSRDDESCYYADVNDCLVVFEDGHNMEPRHRLSQSTAQETPQRVDENLEFDCHLHGDLYSTVSDLSPKYRDSKSFCPRAWSEKSIENVINNPTDPIGKVQVLLFLLAFAYNVTVSSRPPYFSTRCIAARHHAIFGKSS